MSDEKPRKKSIWTKNLGDVVRGVDDETADANVRAREEKLEANRQRAAERREKFKASGIAKVFEGVGSAATEGFKEHTTGVQNEELVCPHCQTKGKVIVKKDTRKDGISGGKATAAAMTGGLSMLGTGLSKHKKVSELRCEECNMKWVVER